MGVSAICPRRTLLQESEPFIVAVTGTGTSQSKKVLKDCGSSRYSDGDLRRLGAIGSGSWCSRSLNFIRLLLFLVLGLFFLSLVFLHGSGLVLSRANDLGRQCLVPQNARLSSAARSYRFAMVTCSDGSSTIPQRSFEGLMDLVAPNKQAYVRRHGYDFIDASDCLDKSRPPSWSKILAVRKHLSKYDWVFWNDADSLVTNPSVRLEDIIDSIVGDAEFEAMPDFIVTVDVTGVNAGMFFFRNSEWSHKFLETWWNQTSFIKPFGQSKSGDNDALKHLVKQMDAAEKKRHVHIAPMQCLFNSNLWTPSWKNGHRLLRWSKSIWRGVYSRGDFIVHLAGMRDKKTWIKKILEDLGTHGPAWSFGRDYYSSRRRGPP